MTRIELRNISKAFGPTRAVDNVSLTVEQGELFFMLGPSGCGKSTLLRVIAGLHEPTSGQILFRDQQSGERDVTNEPTQKRNAVMCFQSYALWPHMSVRDNLLFGLQTRKVPVAQHRQMVDDALKLVQMSDLADRKPNQLSGGQQQRVALARAMVVRPACLLLDEPLSNLDAKLRHEMRSEIRRICKASGLTTIYVTHDQKEALAIADRIAVLRNGNLMQVGSPDDLYHRPNSTFVADFIGQTNLLAGTGEIGSTHVATALGTLEVATPLPAARVMLSIRPERIRLVEGDAPPGGNALAIASIESTFVGEISEHVVKIAGQTLRVVSSPPKLGFAPGTKASFQPQDVVVLKD